MNGAAHGYAPRLHIGNLTTLVSVTCMLDLSHLRSADSLSFDIPRTRSTGDRDLNVKLTQYNFLCPDLIGLRVFR